MNYSETMERCRYLIERYGGEIMRSTRAGGYCGGSVTKPSTIITDLLRHEIETARHEHPDYAVAEIARRCGVSLTTVFNVLRRAGLRTSTGRGHGSGRPAKLRLAAQFHRLDGASGRVAFASIVSGNSDTRGDLSRNVYFRSPEPSKEDEAVAVINELVETMGTQCVIGAFKASKAADGVAGVMGHSDVLRAMRWMLARIIDADDPRKVADVMALCCGLLLREGITITELAAKYGDTKANISKLGVEFCEEIGLPPSHAQLPEEAREKYRVSNRRNVKKGGGR